MDNSTMTVEEATVLNNLEPGNQNVRIGDKLKFTLDMISPPGNVWFVSRNVLVSGNGKSWDQAFKTIGEAISQVNDDYTANVPPIRGRNSIIYIGEGWYSEVPLLLTASDVTIIGLAPGGHDPVVLYGSATAGGFDINSGGPALTVRGANSSIINMGIFTYDVLYPSMRIGGNASDLGLNGGTLAHATGVKLIDCSFVRNVNNASLGGLDVVNSEGPDIIRCNFSTSCKDFGIRIRTNGNTNPVGVHMNDCRFVGTPIGVDINNGSDAIIQHCIFMDDMTDRVGAISTPITNEGNNTIVIENYWEFSKENAITGNGDHLNINNFTLSET
jgi:hypothetical protein